MNKRILVPLCLVFGLMLAACGTATVNTNDPAPPATKTSPATTTTPATTAVASGEKIGVPECDDFIAAYESCINNKVPEMARAQYNAGIAQWRASWKKLADNPQTKSSLVAACKQSMEQTSVAMKSYGCAF